MYIKGSVAMEDIHNCETIQVFRVVYSRQCSQIFGGVSDLMRCHKR